MKTQLGVVPETLMVLEITILIEEQRRTIQESEVVDRTIKAEVELLMAARAVYGVWTGAAPGVVGQVDADRRGDVLVPDDEAVVAGRGRRRRNGERQADHKDR